MNGVEDNNNTPILEVDIEEVRSTSISDSSSSNEPRIRHDSTVRSRHDSNQEQSTSSSVHSFEHPEPEALSPISITNGRKHHRRNLSNLTTGSGRSGSMDSVSLGNSSLDYNTHFTELPTPIDTSTLEDISLHDEDDSEDTDPKKKQNSTTSKMSLLARKLFKRSEPVVLTTNLIFENRPSNLPAKNPEEEQAQRKAYEEMVACAKRKEVAELKKKQRAAEERKKYEESVASCTNVWLKEILPEWHLVNHTKRVHNLWWRGLPPKVRGTIWKLAVGNELQLTKSLYYIMVDRAQDTLRCCKDSTRIQDETMENVRDIRLDVLRTFPSLCIFQENGPYHEQLLNVLGAYASYRPDVGYVQGMSFLTAVLLLNMDPADAFILLSNLLHQPCQRAFFRMDADMMFVYFDVFNLFFEEALPPLFNFFTHLQLTPDLYLIGWVFTLFSKSLPLDVVSRIWDVYFRDGDSFLFAAALGILRMYMPQLLHMEFEVILQFLRKLPEDMNADVLFEHIKAVGLTPRKFQHTMVELVDMNNVERRKKNAAIPATN